MPRFRYSAYNQANERVTAVVEADTIAQARLMLQQRDLVVLSVWPERSQTLNINLNLWISTRDIAFFTKNLAVMLNAGLTVVEALLIAESQNVGKLKKVLASILAYVEEGHTLTEAFTKHRRYFSGVYVDVIRTGELSGTLARNLSQLADRLAADLDLRRKVQGALLYPMIVVAAIIGLGTVLSVYVLPRLIRLFTSINVPLPRATRLLLAGGSWLSEYWFWLLGVLAVSMVVLRLLVRLPAIEAIWHRVILNLPIMGRITRNLSLARFSNTLGSLLKSGVPITEAIQSVIHSSSNAVYRKNIKAALQHIEQGGMLTSHLEQYPHLYPAMVTRMIAVGEHTGQLDTMLLYLGQYYELEVDTSTKQLGVVLEPILLLIIGVAVIFIGISVITPIYEFTASVGRL